MLSPESSKVFRDRLAKALEGHGARSEFCRKTGIARSGLERWLEGEGTVSLESLDRAAKGLGLAPWELLKPAASAANPAAPTRDSLIVGIITRIPRLHDDQLRALFNIVDGFDRDNAETKVPEQLSRKKN